MHRLRSLPKSDPANESKESAHIVENLIATPLPDGYWLHAFPFSKDAKLPDLIGYGLGFEGKPAAIKLFVNPGNAEESVKHFPYASSTETNTCFEALTDGGCRKSRASTSQLE